jgi:hypothetical protein
VPDVAEPRVPWHAGISNAFRTAKERQYSDGRAGFVERSISLRDASISLAQDIEQSYLLHWTDLYKNQFLSRLRQVFVWGVIGSLVTALVGFSIAVFAAGELYENDTPPESSTKKHETISTTRATSKGKRGTSRSTTTRRSTSTTRSARTSGK